MSPLKCFYAGEDGKFQFKLFFDGQWPVNIWHSFGLQEENLDCRCNRWALSESSRMRRNEDWIKKKNSGEELYLGSIQKCRSQWQYLKKDEHSG